MTYKKLKTITGVFFLHLPVESEKFILFMGMLIPLGLVAGHFFYCLIMLFSVLYVIFSPFLNLSSKPEIKRDKWITSIVLILMNIFLYSLINPKYLSVIPAILYILFSCLSIFLLRKIMRENA